MNPEVKMGEGEGYLIFYFCPQSFCNFVVEEGHPVDGR